MAPLIEFCNASYQYPLTECKAIDQMNLSLDKGKLYGVIGENGSGKTTLGAMICGFAPGFYKGDLEGQVLIKGKATTDYGPGELSAIIGYVFQNPFNQISGVKRTVFEELAFGLENFGYEPAIMEEKILTIAADSNIEDLLEKNPFQLSGGQQQRVALASALVLEPEIIVIDEPTSQLDPESTERVFEMIQLIKNKGSTVVLMEHKVDLLAEFADELIVLEEGRLLCQGETHKILQNQDLINHGIQLTHVSMISHEIMERGISLMKVPVTERQACHILGAKLKNGKDE
jgi:energy-coupling factor transport system ATP-binding protein